MRKILSLLLILAFVLSVAPAFGQSTVELRIRWYDDGNEGEVLRDLLDRFQEENPGIVVVLDTVPYSAILEQLPLDLAAGESSDMARVTDLGGLAQYYLDMTPHLSDPAYWEENFGPFLQWLRVPGDESSINGFMTQLTITGPFINRTLFEQAGIPVPSDTSDEVTWQEWAEATKAVADALDIPYPMAIDRSGHRLAGPAISMGALFFDEDGNPTVMDEGFRTMAEMFVNWHLEGIMHPEIWPLSQGYRGANEEFKNGELVLYMSGSWQVQQFSDQIGDDFDWEAVPNPCGPGGCTGMPGGAALVALKDTRHPAEVAMVMEYLTREDVLAEFSARTLFIPGHAGVSAMGVDFDTDLELAKEALDVFVAEVGKLEQTALDLQAYAFNRAVFDAARDRLSQVIVGEMTLDEAIARIQDDVDTALAARSS